MFYADSILGKEYFILKEEVEEAQGVLNQLKQDVIYQRDEEPTRLGVSKLESMCNTKIAACNHWKSIANIGREVSLVFFTRQFLFCYLAPLICGISIPLLIDYCLCCLVGYIVFQYIYMYTTCRAELYKDLHACAFSFSRDVCYINRCLEVIPLVEQNERSLIVAHINYVAYNWDHYFPDRSFERERILSKGDIIVDDLVTKLREDEANALPYNRSLVKNSLESLTVGLLAVPVNIYANADRAKKIYFDTSR